MYLRDTLRLPALRQAQDRRRGFAPLHTPYFISLLGLQERISTGKTDDGLAKLDRPCLGHQRPQSFTSDDALEAALGEKVEHYDGDVVFHAEG